jgi:hypothetical protein
MAPHHRHSGRKIKERVLHTRVPEGLEIELKRLADSLRVTVSNVVRAVLENALETVEAAELATQTASSAGERFDWLRRLRSYDEGGDTEVSLVDGKDSQRSDKGNISSRKHEHKKESVDRMMRSVIGFQPLTLAKITRCAFCHREIEPEQPAYVSVRDRKGPMLIVGAECLPRNDQTKNEAEVMT